MTKIWEAYVHTWLISQLPAGHRLSAQHPVLLTDDQSAIRAFADFVILDEHNHPVQVYDAKYKNWRAKPSTEDLYQLVTYAHRLRVQQAALLYPGHGNEHGQVSIGNIRLTTLGLPVLSPMSTPRTPIP
jgi:5-methylcytosine-specific restriction endonuclease McrBC regulatory subunit McrC